MHNQDIIVITLKNYAYDLAQSLIKAKQNDSELYDAHFAFNIIAVLYKYRQDLLLLNKIHKFDLIDSIDAHKKRYLTALVNSKFTIEQTNQYETYILEIINLLKEHSKPTAEEVDDSTVEEEANPLRIRINKITNNVRLLLAQKNHNILASDCMQACAIAYAIVSLDFQNQDDLIERLLLVKEIWSIESEKEASIESIKYKFQHDIFDFISNDFKNSIDAANQITDLLSSKYNSLPYLTDSQIINLYNRLKNHELKDNSIVNLIDRIHKEARIRYSYNRLSESQYELVSLFQNLDALVFHQGKLKFGVIKAYLLDKKNFPQALITLLFEQVDNIRAFALDKDEVLISIINKINQSLSLPSENNDKAKNDLNILKTTIAAFLDINIQKKYANLDKYTFITLVQKYKNLFNNILLLLNEDESSKLFLKEGLIKMITKEFHLPNLNSSVEKIRLNVIEKAKIKEELLKINLEEIFINTEVNNKVQDLDFKEVSINPDIKSSTDYIHMVLKKIIHQCSPWQLNILYKPSLDSTKIDQLYLYIRQEIKEEVAMRTSFVKMIMATISGQKKEYEQLISLKNLL